MFEKVNKIFNVYAVFGKKTNKSADKHNICIYCILFYILKSCPSDTFILIDHTCLVFS